MNNSTKLTRGGIFTSLTIILLYSISIFPTSKLTLMTLASCLIPFSIVTIGFKYSWLIYASSSILSFIFIDKKIALLYILFLGLYGFLKCLIEKVQKIYIEIILKLLSFNICTFIYYFVFKTLFIPINFLGNNVYILLLVSQIAFLVYDYALTLIISFYIKKFQK